MAVDVEDRAERFARQIGELRIEDPAPGRHALWLRVGVALMVAGLACAVIAVIRALGTTDPLVQRDSLALGQLGIAAVIVGTGVYLRCSLTKVLRFWFARMSYEQQQQQPERARQEGIT